MRRFRRTFFSAGDARTDVCNPPIVFSKTCHSWVAIRLNRSSYEPGMDSVVFRGTQPSPPVAKVDCRANPTTCFTAREPRALTQLRCCCSPEELQQAMPSPKLRRAWFPTCPTTTRCNSLRHESAPMRVPTLYRRSANPFKCSTCPVERCNRY